MKFIPPQVNREESEVNHSSGNMEGFFVDKCKFGRKDCLIDTKLSCLRALGGGGYKKTTVLFTVQFLNFILPKCIKNQGQIILEKFISSRDGFVKAPKQGKNENTCQEDFPTTKWWLKRRKKTTLHLLHESTQEDLSTTERWWNRKIGRPLHIFRIYTEVEKTIIVL